MVLSAKGRAAAAKVKARLKANQKRKDKARGFIKTKDLSGRPKKKKFIGTQIGTIKVNPGKPTSPERAKEIRALEKISVRRQLSRAKTTGAVKEKNGRLIPTTKRGASTLSRLASVEGRTETTTTKPPEKVDLLLSLEDFTKGEGEVFTRSKEDKTIERTGQKVTITRIKPEIVNEAVKDFLKNERLKAVTIKGQRITKAEVADRLDFEKQLLKEKKAFQGELRAAKKPNIKNILKARSNKFKKDLLIKIQGLNIAETEAVISRSLGLTAAERALLIGTGKFKPRTKVGKFVKSVTQELISETLTKPIENTALLLTGVVIGKTVRAGSKITKFVSRSNPRIAKILKGGGKVGGVALIGAYARGVVLQGQKELASKGSISSTTAKAIKEITLLGLGTKLASGKPVSKTTSKRFEAIKAQAKDLSKIKASKGKKPLITVKDKPILKKRADLTYWDYKANKYRTASNRKSFLKAIKAQDKFLQGQNKVKLQKEALELEKQRRVLRKQLAESKKGKTPKAPRSAPATLDGKKVYPFEDYSSGKIRYFTSRKLWLKAVKEQQRLITRGIIKVPTKSISSKATTTASKDLRKVALNQAKKVKVSKVKPKPTKKVEISISKNGKNFKVVRGSDGTTKVFVERTVKVKSGNQVLLKKQKQLLKTVSAKASTKSKSALKTLTTLKSKSALKKLSSVLLADVLLKQALGLKLEQLSLDKLKLSQKQGLEQFKLQDLSNLQSLRQVTIQKQSQTQVQKPKITQKPALVNLSKLLTVQKLVTKTRTKKVLLPKKKPKVSKVIGSKAPGYFVQIKKRGKWVNVASNRLSRTNAKNFGKWLADNSVAASIRTKKANDKVNTNVKGLSSLKSKFRRSKSKNLPTTLVEFRKHRIDTIGEIQGLSASRVANSIGLSRGKLKSVKKPKRRKVVSKSKKVNAPKLKQFKIKELKL